MRAPLRRFKIAAAPLANSRRCCRDPGWRRERPSGNLSRQLRRRSAGAYEAKHTAAPCASGTDASESESFVAGQNEVGTATTWEGTIARRAGRRIRRLASVDDGIAAGDVRAGVLGGRNPVEGADALDQRAGIVELSIDVGAPGRSRAGS